MKKILIERALAKEWMDSEELHRFDISFECKLVETRSGIDETLADNTREGVLIIVVRLLILILKMLLNTHAWRKILGKGKRGFG